MASGVGWVAAWSSCWKITVCFDIGRLICASKYSRTSDSTLQPAMTSIRVMCGGWRSDARSGVNLQSLGIHSSTLQPLCISNFVISGLPVKTAAINGVVPQWSAVSSWAPADSRRLTTAVCPASIAFINGVFCSPFSVLCTNHKLHYLHIISPIYSSAAHVYKSNSSRPAFFSKYRRLRQTASDDQVRRTCFLVCRASFMEQSSCRTALRIRQYCF